MGNSSFRRWLLFRWAYKVHHCEPRFAKSEPGVSAKGSFHPPPYPPYLKRLIIIRLDDDVRILTIVRVRGEAHFSRHSVARVVLFRQVVILFVGFAVIFLVGHLIVLEEPCFFGQAHLDWWKESEETIHSVPQLPGIDSLVLHVDRRSVVQLLALLVFVFAG